MDRVDADEVKVDVDKLIELMKLKFDKLIELMLMKLKFDKLIELMAAIHVDMVK